MDYKIKILDNININWDIVEKANIDKYVWSEKYTPVSYAQIVYIKEKGLVIRMTSFEKNPKSIYTDFFDAVYKDSCLEFFAALSDKKDMYINCEMNSNGASLIAVGSSRYNRTPINEIIDSIPPVKAEKFHDYWTVELFLSSENINKVFGEIEFKSGYKFKGNLYKCGDDTEIEHYGMWSPVGTTEPDFHKPEYFANFILE